jgi:hypothetical protein
VRFQRPQSLVAKRGRKSFPSTLIQRCNVLSETLYNASRELSRSKILICPHTHKKWPARAHIWPQPPPLNNNYTPRRACVSGSAVKIRARDGEFLDRNYGGQRLAGRWAFLHYWHIVGRSHCCQATPLRHTRQVQRTKTHIYSRHTSERTRT